MGTLRDELSKLPPLDSLRFDDDPADAQTPAAVGSPPATQPASQHENFSRRLFDWLRQHPSSTPYEIALALGVDSMAVSQVLYNLRRREIVDRKHYGNAYHYSCAVPEYPASKHSEALQKAWARRRELGAQRRAAKAAGVEPPPTPKRAAPQAPTPLVGQPLDIDQLLSSLSITQARALYDRLVKIFTT